MESNKTTESVPFEEGLDLPFSRLFVMGMLILHVTLVSIGCLGCLCITTVFFSDRSLWRPSNIFIFFLNLVDMLHITTMGIFKAGFLTGWAKRWTREEGCWWLGALTVVLMTLSHLTTVLIAVNRYIRVCFSNVIYARIFPPYAVFLMCLFLIGCASLWAIQAPVLYYSSLPGCFLHVRLSRFRLLLMFMQYIVGYCVVVILYCVMTKKLSRLRKNLNRKMASQRPSPSPKPSVAIPSKRTSDDVKATQSQSKLPPSEICTQPINGAKVVQQSEVDTEEVNQLTSSCPYFSETVSLVTSVLPHSTSDHGHVVIPVWKEFTSNIPESTEERNKKKDSTGTSLPQVPAMCCVNAHGATRRPSVQASGFDTQQLRRRDRCSSVTLKSKGSFLTKQKR